MKFIFMIIFLLLYSTKCFKSSNNEFLGFTNNTNNINVSNNDGDSDRLNQFHTNVLTN
jgi:hypothetical protein